MEGGHGGVTVMMSRVASTRTCQAIAAVVVVVEVVVVVAASVRCCSSHVALYRPSLAAPPLPPLQPPFNAAVLPKLPYISSARRDAAAVAAVLQPVVSIAPLIPCPPILAAAPPPR